MSEDAMSAQVTACTLDCPDACSILCEVDPSGAIRLRGNPHHPVTAGFMCGKPGRAVRRACSEERITRPLMRQGSHWRSISWDQALDLCAEQIQQRRSRPESILHVQGEGNKGLTRFAPLRFFAELGSSRIRGCVCDSTGIEACIADFGSLECNDIRTLAEARRIVNWGKDLSRSSIHVAALVREARNRGAAVVTISPGGDGNRRFSDGLIRIRPGTDRFLAAAVMQKMRQDGVIDPALPACARHWPELQELLDSRSPEELSRACDVAPEAIDTLYRIYAAPEPTATILGWGLQRYRFGGENVRFINALAFLSGNIGRRGGGSTFNISSARNFDLSRILPKPEKPRRSLLLPAIGRDIRDADPAVEMIWVNGTNVVNQTPESKEIARALREAAFTVVVDAFLTDTAAAADLVLPCTLLMEREDVTGSFLHDFVNHVAPVLDAPEGVKSDLEILREIGRRLEPPILMPSRETLLDWGLQSAQLDSSLDELREKGFIRADHPVVAFEDLRFSHPDGKYRFPAELHDEPTCPAEYPVKLLTLVRRNQLHSQIPPAQQTLPPSIRVAPDSPACRGLDLARPVDLVSPLGRLRVTVELESGLHPEAIVYRRGDWMGIGGGANQLVSAMTTDMGEGTAFYSQPVRLENAPGTEREPAE